MKLVELDSEYQVIVNPELFLIDCFAALRDDRKNPKLLLKELGYIYFFYNMKSEFQFQTNKAERAKDVKRRCKLDEKWKVDKLLLECIDVYLYLSQTVGGSILESAYLMADKIKDQMNLIDLNERDKSNKPIWNVKQMVDTSKSLPDLMESLNKAEMTYMKGQNENNKLRGDKLKTLYEDGFKKR